jgi:aspartate/methionine/tyrosine aminotransferase
MVTATRFRPFDLERWQSDWEHRVQINLADSGVLPMHLRDLVQDDLGFGEVTLHYPEVQGDLALRERIAALHPGADPDNVLVTVGGSEANQVVANTLLEAGDRVAVMRPGYLQLHGLALNLGCEVTSLDLRQEDGWRLDPRTAQTCITTGTRLVSITNPNNPTGAVLGAEEIGAVVAACDASGAWLHVDEVYRGSELDGHESPSLFGATSKTIVVGSLSKSYALPGLRIGWIVAPHGLIGELWRRHEYATISASSVSMYLGSLALSSPRRESLLQRQRDLATRGLGVVNEWIRENADVVSLVSPRATALAFVRYARSLSSVELSEKLRDEARVLVAPGAYLGAEQHLRIAHALDPERTQAALQRISDVIRSAN